MSDFELHQLCLANQVSPYYCSHVFTTPGCYQPPHILLPPHVVIVSVLSPARCYQTVRQVYISLKKVKGTQRTGTYIIIIMVIMTLTTFFLCSVGSEGAAV